MPREFLVEDERVNDFIKLESAHSLARSLARKRHSREYASATWTVFVGTKNCKMIPLVETVV